MTISYIRLQISDSGAFNEPDNGVDLWPFDLPTNQRARVSEVAIASSDGILQQTGVGKRKGTIRAMFIGDWSDKKIKEEALRNVEFHQSNSSFQGRPVTVSFILGGVTQETIDAFITNYNIGQRRGRHNIFDVDLNFTEV